MIKFLVASSAVIGNLKVVWFESIASSSVRKGCTKLKSYVSELMNGVLENMISKSMR
jgi:hypothetical protein